MNNLSFLNKVIKHAKKNNNMDILENATLYNIKSMYTDLKTMYVLQKGGVIKIPVLLLKDDQINLIKKHLWV